MYLGSSKWSTDLTLRRPAGAKTRRLHTQSSRTISQNKIAYRPNIFEEILCEIFVLYGIYTTVTNISTKKTRDVQSWQYLNWCRRHKIIIYTEQKRKSYTTIINILWESIGQNVLIKTRHPANDSSSLHQFVSFDVWVMLLYVFKAVFTEFCYCTCVN